MEKTVLLNAEVADQMAATIALHTRGDTRTVFFDGEGGPCHLGARVRDMGLFRSGEAEVLQFCHRYCIDRQCSETEMACWLVFRILANQTACQWRF